MSCSLRLVLKYLKEEGYCESFVTLEREAGVTYCSYSKQIDFFRKIILKGDFEEAVKFLRTFEYRIEEQEFKKAVLEIYRQKLYELIDNPDEGQLRTLFQRELPNYCSDEDYQIFFGWLSSQSVSEINGQPKWTPLKGRNDCFEAILPYLELLTSDAKADTAPKDNLTDIINAFYENQQPGKADSKGDQKLALRSEVKERPKGVVESQADLNWQNGDKKKKQFGKISLHQINLSNTSNGRFMHKDEPMSESRMEKSEVVGEKNREVAPITESKNEKSQIFGKISMQKVQINDRSRMAQEKIEDQQMKKTKIIPNASLPMPRTLKNESQLKMDNQVKMSEEPAWQPMVSKVIKVVPPDNSQQNNARHLRSYDKPNSYLPTVNYGSDQIRELPEDVQEEVRKNIEYLQQTSSAQLRDSQLSIDQQDNFTFSQQDADKSPKKIKLTCLGTICDGKAIRTCQFSRSGAYFAVGTNSSVLKIFQVSQLFESRSFSELVPSYQIDKLHLKSIFCLNWSTSERSLITSSNDLCIQLTELAKNLTDHKTTLIGKHESCVRMVRFNASEMRVYSCGDDSLIKVWDLGKTKKCTSLKGHTASVNAFKLLKDETDLYSVSRDATLRRWDLRVNQCVAISKQQQSQLTYIAQETDRILVSHKNGQASFFHNTLQLDHSLQLHDDEVRSIDVLPYDNTILTASFDGNLALFNETRPNNINYFQHNQSGDDKVVFATFLQHPTHRGFASTSTQGLCHIFAYD